MDIRGQVTLDSIRAYSDKYGRKQTEECLKRLGILQQFYNAYSLPIGKELLLDINNSMIVLSKKILTDPESTSDDKAMFRAYSSIAQSWAKKVGDYTKLVEDIKDAH